MAGVEREGAARDRVERFYEPFERLKREGLDALIVTGANVTEADITREAFWEPLIEVLDWGAGERRVDALLVPREPRRLPVAARGAAHPPAGEAVGGLLASGAGTARPPPSSPGSTTRFETPHSRFKRRAPRGDGGGGPQGARRERRGRGPRRDEPGRLSASSTFQGHPEYDRESLLKEYKREVGRYLRGECEDYPAESPENYFAPSVERRFAAYREEDGASARSRRHASRVPGGGSAPRARQHLDRHRQGPSSTTGSGSSTSSPTTTGAAPFAPGVDPDDPPRPPLIPPADTAFRVREDSRDDAQAGQPGNQPGAPRAIGSARPPSSRRTPHANAAPAPRPRFTKGSSRSRVGRD